MSVKNQIRTSLLLIIIGIGSHSLAATADIKLTSLAYGSDMAQLFSVDITVDDSCASGQHNEVLQQPELAVCIVEFITTRPQSQNTD